jgi:hypothetical protein
MKTILVLAFLLCSFVPACLGAIGEDLAATEARYGSPMKFETNASGQVVGYYWKKDFLIGVMFENGKSVFLSYFKKNKAPLSKGEIETLLINNLGANYEKYSYDSHEGFLSQDKLSLGVVGALSQDLTITTLAQMEKEKSKKDLMERSAAAGL